MMQAETCEALRQVGADFCKGVSGRQVVSAPFQSSFLIFETPAPVDFGASACPESSFERAG